MTGQIKSAIGQFTLTVEPPLKAGETVKLQNTGDKDYVKRWVEGKDDPSEIYGEIVEIYEHEGVVWVNVLPRRTA